MFGIFYKIKNKLKFFYTNFKSLSGKGERVDLFFQENINFGNLDVYQKSHYRRYEFAQRFVNKDDVCGDFACGTGYGTVMLSKRAKMVIGVDINSQVINKIRKRYKNEKNIEFRPLNLLNLDYENKFDKIISFETIEHLEEGDIPKLFFLFSRALKNNGHLLFSVPHKQEKSEAAIKMGFHLTFQIDEEKIKKWLEFSNLSLDFSRYQNYKTHEVSEDLMEKDFIICVAKKND